ncbi:uncharacterized protein LOC134396412 [Elgaria multicarinata webbii]|uniref:uncharacterized protein LOC134396412 n=1 Tax=Elgaria multicarinata webbii TaxID=159646 RepID=UPI002FCD32A4
MKWALIEHYRVHAAVETEENPLRQVPVEMSTQYIQLEKEKLEQRKADRQLELEKIKQQEEQQERLRGKDREAEIRLREKDRELELERIALEKRKFEREDQRRIEEGTRPPKLSPKDFTPYIEGQDPQIFFNTFEKAAMMWEVKPQDYMKFIPNLIKGDLAEIYNSFPVGEALDFASFKTAVYKRFHYGPEYFQKKFRSLNDVSSKSFVESGHKLVDHFEKWITCTEVKTKQDLVDLMIKDQLIFQIPQDIRLLVRDRDPKTYQDAASLADQFSLNRGYHMTSKSTKENNIKPGDKHNGDKK